MSIVSLIIAPHIAVEGGHHGKEAGMMHGQKMECCAPGTEMKGSCEGMDMGACDMEKCMSMSEEECAAYCDSLKCTPEQKAKCLEMRKVHEGMMDGKHSCMEGCNHGCKTDAECKEHCGDKCTRKES